MIVAPVSTLENWARELRKWCPKLRVVVYHGTEAERDEIREKIKRGACHVSPRPPRVRPPRAAALDGRRYRASCAGGARLNVFLTAYSLFELETGKKKAERAFLTKLGRCGSPSLHMGRVGGEGARRA